MDDVAKLAREIVQLDGLSQPPIIRFQVVEMAGRCRHPKSGYRMVQTDRQEVVRFFLACYNARRELAASLQPRPALANQEVM